MTRQIEFDEQGNIMPQSKLKAIVRFPTEEEQAKGIMEVPRDIRVKESTGGN